MQKNTTHFQLTINPINNINATNDKVKLPDMLTAITIVMLAVTTIKTHLVIVVVLQSSTSCCIMLIALFNPALAVFNFKSNSNGNEKFAYPSISNPLQLTNASKHEALYVNATIIHGRTFEKINEGRGATPASWISVSFASRQYTIEHQRAAKCKS